MTSKADRILNDAMKQWKRNCPDDPMDADDIRGAIAACVKFRKALATARLELKSASKGASLYEDFDEKSVNGLLKEVENYDQDLEEQEKEFDLVKKWLSRVRTSDKELPFSLVIQGNDRGSLYVSKHESVVTRSARAGKSEITGSKMHDGFCLYENGKLVFRFESTARAPWRMVLQKIINKAGLNMKVAIRGLADDDDTSLRDSSAD